MDPIIKQILIFSAIALSSVLVLLNARAIAIRFLHKRANKTATLLDIQRSSEPQRELLVPIGVSKEAGIEVVEQLLLEVSQKAIGEVPGLLATPAPQVRLQPGTGETSLEFMLVVQVREFADQAPIQHELRKRIFREFEAKDIGLPYPHRTVQVKREQ